MTNDPSHNAHVRAVRAMTLWRITAATRGPIYDILPLLLSSPFIPCPLLVSCHSPVVVPFRLTQRRSANCGSSNRGDGSRNTCFRTSTSSVPVLSYCTCPGLRCLTSSLHCYTPTRLLLGVTHPISHHLPQPGNNFFRS